VTDRRLGTVFVNEQPFPINRIYLSQGQFVFEIVLRDHGTVPDNSEARVHDPEGNLVVTFLWQVTGDARRFVGRKLLPGDVVTINQALTVNKHASIEWLERVGS
jgi:hypothetical protein